VLPRLSADVLGVAELPWPLDPQRGRHEVVGTLGEVRGSHRTTTRAHDDHVEDLLRVGHRDASFGIGGAGSGEVGGDRSRQSGPSLRGIGVAAQELLAVQDRKSVV
jgi:hypothetical protein